MIERRPPWRKSTYSNGSSSCIETAVRHRNVVVRDSRDPIGPQLTVQAATWRAFTRRLQDR